MSKRFFPTSTLVATLSACIALTSACKPGSEKPADTDTDTDTSGEVEVSKKDRIAAKIDSKGGSLELETEDMKISLEFPEGALDKPGGIEPIMVSLAVSFILMIAVSLATYKPDTATPKIF